MKLLFVSKHWLSTLIVFLSAGPLMAQTVPAPATPPIPITPPTPLSPLATPFVVPPSSAPYSTAPTMFYTQKALAGGDILNALQVAPGVWWNDDGMVAKLGLTNDQRRKMDEILQQFRLQLIDLNAALDKEELVLEPLVGAQTLDQAKIIAQIDRVAAARAELEKANARLLLGLQQALTAEQRAKLPRNQVAKKLRYF